MNIVASIGRCFHVDLWGFCTRKNGTNQYVDFGSNKGEFQNGDDNLMSSAAGCDNASNPWDTDVQDLSAMEFNIVEEQPNGIILRIHDHDAENLETVKSESDTEDTDETSGEVCKDVDVDFKGLNNNEHSELIKEEELPDSKENCAT